MKFTFQVRKKFKQIFIVLLLVYVSAQFRQVSSDSATDGNQLERSHDDYSNLTANEIETKWSEIAIKVLEHYQLTDPVGVPVIDIPDPMKVPDMKHSFSVTTINFKEIEAHGISKFRITHVNLDLAKMQAESGLRIETLLVNGSYTMSTWFSRSAGPFTVRLYGVNVKAIGNLAVERGGRLTLQDIAMDCQFERIEMNFENLGFMGSLFQGIINSVGTFLFDSIKPFILNQANTNIRGNLNQQIAKLDYTFPNSISPFDMAIAEARKFVRDRGYDPYKIDDYNHTIGLFDVTLSNTWVTGLSGFYRNGNITIEIINGTILAIFDVGTQRLKGTSHWEVGVVGGVLSRAGTFTFSVEHFKVKTAIKQSVDTRQHPILEDLQLELGNIQIRFNGAGTVDYIIEFLVNILPNLLRYQIMDALEGPITTRIQRILNKTNLDQMARENLHYLDDVQKNGFNF